MKALSQLLTFSLLALSVQFAYAQAVPSPNPAEPQQTATNTYAGYSQNYLQAADVSPYHVVGPQDINPLIVGYGLLQKPNEVNFDPNKAADYLKNNYDTPFFTNSLVKPSTTYTPNVFGRTPTDILIGSMFFTIPAQQLSIFFKQAENAFQPAPLTSSTSFNNNTVANVTKPNSFDYMISDEFAAPYNAASLFHYATPNKDSATSATSNVMSAYDKNPAEVYMSLVSGALTPVAVPDKITPDFTMRLRRIIAVQTAGTYALQNIFARTQPLSHFDADMLKQINNVFSDASRTPPQNARELEKYMATRRLDPASGWYQHLQSASPEELQREQLYLQAEILYELQKIHENEEQNQMLLAVNLLSQNYFNRVNLTQMQQTTTG